MSTKSGRAPAWLIASVVAMKVCGTVSTMSPGCTPAAINANRTASVPLAHAHAMLRVAKLGELVFEILDHRAADETGRVQRLLETRQ